MKNKLFLAVLGALTIGGAGIVTGKTESVLAEDSYKLSFDTQINEVDCCSTVNGWFPISTTSLNSIITIDFKNDNTFGYNNPGVISFVAGRTYSLEFSLKASTSDSFAIFEVAPDAEWIQLDLVMNDTTWTKYSYEFTATYNNSNIMFQQASQLSVLNIKEMYMFEISRPVVSGTEIGNLPPLPEGASSWGIDGEAIDETTLYKWTSDKVASPIYPSSLVNAFTLDGTSLAKNMSNNKNMESVSIEDNEITMIATAPQQYVYSEAKFSVTAGHTYYLVGKYKTSEGSGLHIAINDPWVLGVEAGNHRQYTTFYLEFTAPTTRLIQFIFQCAYNNFGKATFCLKDCYFGEGFKVNYGSTFSSLPNPTEENDYWTIGGQQITTSSINNYAENLNIEYYCANPLYNIYFPLKSYVGSEPSTLVMPLVGNFTENVLSVEENHVYYVSFEYQTSEFVGIRPFIFHEVQGEEWREVGYTGITSPGVYSTVEYTFTAWFTGDLKLIIQNAYNDKGLTPVFTVKNYNAYELIRLHNGDEFGTLPTFPVSDDPLLIAYAWSIDGENEIKSNSIFNGNSDTFMTILYDLPHYTLSFEAEGYEFDSIEVKYNEEIGTLPEVPVAEAGHHYVWVIGDDEITSETVYSYTEDVTATLKLITNVYNIVFKADNVTLETREIEYGTAIGSFPSYSPDEKYDYHWEIDGETVTVETLFNFESNKDCVLVKTLKVHTATFVADGETVGTATFNLDGYLEELPAVPEKPGYNGVWDNVKLINADMTVNAIYTPKTFNIYFLDMNGNRLAMYKITYGQNLYEAVTAWPEAPAVEGYTFVSFQYNGEEVKITDKYEYTEDIALTAVYTKNPEEPKEEPNKKGCKGSVVASSAIISVLAITGIGLVINKRKEDK